MTACAAPLNLVLAAFFFAFSSSFNLKWKFVNNGKRPNKMKALSLTFSFLLSLSASVPSPVASLLSKAWAFCL